MNAEIRDVIEAHRQAVGAESVHVTLGENATPEGLAKAFADIRVQTGLLDAFRPEERAQAEVKRLRKLLRKVDGLARAGNTSAIISAVDLVPDVVMDADLHFMADQRRKRGEELPEGLQDWLDAHPLKS